MVRAVRCRHAGQIAAGVVGVGRDPAEAVGHRRGLAGGVVGVRRGRPVRALHHERLAQRVVRAGRHVPQRVGRCADLGTGSRQVGKVVALRGRLGRRARCRGRALEQAVAVVAIAGKLTAGVDRGQQADAVVAERRAATIGIVERGEVAAAIVDQGGDLRATLHDRLDQTAGVVEGVRLPAGVGDGSQIAAAVGVGGDLAIGIDDVVNLPVVSNSSLSPPNWV